MVHALDRLPCRLVVTRGTLSVQFDRMAGGFELGVTAQALGGFGFNVVKAGQILPGGSEMAVRALPVEVTGWLYFPVTGNAVHRTSQHVVGFRPFKCARIMAEAALRLEVICGPAVEVAGLAVGCAGCFVIEMDLLPQDRGVAADTVALVVAGRPDRRMAGLAVGRQPGIVAPGVTGLTAYQSVLRRPARRNAARPPDRRWQWT